MAKFSLPAITSKIPLDLRRFTDRVREYFKLLEGIETERLVTSKIIQGTAGSGSGKLEIQDEGLALVSNVNKINFIGPGVSLSSPVAGFVDVTILAVVAPSITEFCPNYTYTFVDTDTWRVTGLDVSNLFAVGRRCRFTDGASSYYGVVSGVDYGITLAGTTTIDMAMEGSDVLNATISEVCLVSSSTAWSPISDSPFGGTACNDIACGTVGVDYYTVAVGAAGKVFYSTDNGLTWTAGVSGQAEDIQQVIYDPVNEQFIYNSTPATDLAGTRFSVDGGATWSSLAPLAATLQEAWIQIDSLNLYAPISNSQVNYLPLADLSGGSWSSHLSLDNMNNGRWFLWENGFNANFFSLTELLWMDYAPSLTNTDFRDSTGLSFPSGNIVTDQLEIPGSVSLLAATNGNLFRTTDTVSPVGTDWLVGSTVFGGNDINGLAYSGPSLGRIVAVGASGTIAYSNDNGATFILTPNGFGPMEDITAVAYCDAPGNPVFIAASELGTICRSTNGIN